MIHLTVLFFLTINSFAKDEAGLNDHARIDEIRKALSQIKLDSQKSKVKLLAPQIAEHLPEIITGIDEHILQVDQEIGQFSLRLQNIKSLIEIANMKIEIEKKLRPATAESSKYTSQIIQEECEIQATIISPSNIEMRSPIIKVLDQAISGTEDLMSTLDRHKSAITDLKSSVDSGSSIANDLDDELDRVNKALANAQYTQNLVEGFKKQVLTRYQQALNQRYSGRTAEITQVRAQTQVCFNQTLSLSRIQEQMSKPQQTSVPSITAPVPAPQSVSSAK